MQQKTWWHFCCPRLSLVLDRPVKFSVSVLSISLWLFHHQTKTCQCHKIHKVLNDCRWIVLIIRSVKPGISPLPLSLEVLILVQDLSVSDTVWCIMSKFVLLWFHNSVGIAVIILLIILVKSVTFVWCLYCFPCQGLLNLLVVIERWTLDLSYWKVDNSSLTWASPLVYERPSCSANTGQARTGGSAREVTHKSFQLLWTSNQTCISCFHWFYALSSSMCTKYSRSIFHM